MEKPTCLKRKKGSPKVPLPAMNCIEARDILAQLSQLDEDCAAAMDWAMRTDHIMGPTGLNQKLLAKDMGWPYDRAAAACGRIRDFLAGVAADG